MKKGKSKLPEFGYKIFKPILGFIFKTYFNPKIIGKENIPKDGPIIVAANHKHLMDQCGPILSTKRILHYLAKKEYFDKKRTAWFFKVSGCIPVDRTIHDENAKSEAMKVLEDGKALGIFPEGTRNRTKDFLLPFKFGCVSMAKKTDAYIVPIGISGDYKFRSKNLVYRIGKPFKVGDMELPEANKKLEKQIGNLIKKGMQK
jgi:1-acyl-sn-glycerol-3-phosphate acyltransferase